MKKLLRLWVMTKINHSDEYVKGAMASADVDYTNLTHQQISAYKAALKSTEADLLIESAFDKSKPVSVNDFDVSVFKPCLR